MIEEKTLMSVGYLEKQNLTGSYRGMRYLLRKQGEKDAPRLGVVVWPQPMNFENSAEESRTETELEFSKEGLRQAAQWLNEQYEAKREIWDSARL